MCGVLGIKGSTTLGQGKILLQMLTHRGQDASGLSWYEETKNKMSTVKSDSYPDLLALNENFKTYTLLGSTRYPTFGTRTDSSNIESYAQPFSISTKYGNLSIVHNGNTTNLSALSNKIYESDAQFITDFLGSLVDKEEGNLESAIKELMQKIDGSYSIVGVFKNQLFAFRDPRGLRPLIVGSNESITLVTSESVVLQNLGIEKFEDVKPGELILINKKEIIHKQLQQKDHAHCMFEFVYFAHPCSCIEKRLVYDVRLELGRELGYRIKETMLDIDYIIPVPDTSKPASQALSEVLKVPVREAIIKNRYLQRTFIMKSKEERSSVAKRKYLYSPSYIKGKSILVVDDSIVRGLTSQKIIKDLRKIGAKNIYLAVTCPAIRFACYYGIDFPNDDELIASGYKIEEIKNILNVDELFYQNIESLKKSIGFSDLCTACLSGCYPTTYAQEIRIKYLNGELKNRSHYEVV